MCSVQVRHFLDINNFSIGFLWEYAFLATLSLQND